MARMWRGNAKQPASRIYTTVSQTAHVSPRRRPAGFEPPADGVGIVDIRHQQQRAVLRGHLRVGGDGDLLRQPEALLQQARQDHDCLLAAILNQRALLFRVVQPEAQAGVFAHVAASSGTRASVRRRLSR